MSSRLAWSSAQGRGLVHPADLQSWDVQGAWSRQHLRVKVPLP